MKVHVSKCEFNGRTADLAAWERDIRTQRIRGSNVLLDLCIKRGIPKGTKMELCYKTVVYSRHSMTVRSSIWQHRSHHPSLQMKHIAVILSVVAAAAAIGNMPPCAEKCLSDAVIKACGKVDFNCACSPEKFSAIKSGAAPCVIGACGSEAGSRLLCPVLSRDKSEQLL